MQTLMGQLENTSEQNTAEVHCGAMSVPHALVGWALYVGNGRVEDITRKFILAFVSKTNHHFCPRVPELGVESGKLNIIISSKLITTVCPQILSYSAM